MNIRAEVTKAVPTAIEWIAVAKASVWCSSIEARSVLITSKAKGSPVSAMAKKKCKNIRDKNIK